MLIKINDLRFSYPNTVLPIVLDYASTRTGLFSAQLQIIMVILTKKLRHSIVAKFQRCF
jgi:hypothetical protein